MSAVNTIPYEAGGPIFRCRLVEVLMVRGDQILRLKVYEDSVDEFIRARERSGWVLEHVDV
jgi:hypothetical protein